MSMEIFRNWLDHYPFIRAIISESMMPRVWTLQRIVAVRPFDKEFMIDTNPQITSQSTFTTQVQESEFGDFKRNQT